MSPSTLRARAAGYFLTPKPRPIPTGDLIPLVRRDPPPRAGFIPPAEFVSPGHAAPAGFIPPAEFVPRGHAEPAGFVPPAEFVPPGHAARAGLIARGHAGMADSPGRAGLGAAGHASPPTRRVTRAAVLGPAPAAVAAAAALAGALRASQGLGAAVVATWTPGAAPPLRGPGAPGAIRIAARLSARGLESTAHGRLAWLPLSHHVVAASVAARRASAALEVPLVLALSGPRCDIVEALLGEQDLVVVATTDPDGPMARLAVTGSPATALACTPPAGIRRLFAVAGLAGAWALPEADLRDTVASRTGRASRRSRGRGRS